MPPWWRHQMETFSALLAICAGNSPVSGEFPALRPVTRSFDVFFDQRPNKRLCKKLWGWWFDTRRAHYDVIVMSNRPKWPLYRCSLKRCKDQFQNPIMTSGWKYTSYQYELLVLKSKLTLSKMIILLRNRLCNGFYQAFFIVCLNSMYVGQWSCDIWKVCLYFCRSSVQFTKWNNKETFEIHTPNITRISTRKEFIHHQ